METETISKLFLELAQVVNALTPLEVATLKCLKEHHRWHLEHADEGGAYSDSKLCENTIKAIDMAKNRLYDADYDVWKEKPQ
jgi:hypothetical protein